MKRGDARPPFRRERHHPLVLVFALACALTPRAAFSQDAVRLGRWSGALDFDVNWNDESVSSTTVPQAYRGQRFTEAIRLRNTAAILDPQFLFLSYGLTFSFIQDSFANGLFDGSFQEASGSGGIQNYDIEGTLFGMRDIKYSFLANHTNSRLPRVFSGDINVDTVNRGLSVDFRKLLVPSTVTYRNTELNIEAVGDVLARGRDETRHTLTYIGKRRWTLQRLDTKYELEDLTDRIVPSLSNRNQTLSILHRHDNDPKNATRSLQSSLSYFDRAGSVEAGFDSTFLNLDERLQLWHSDRLSTQYRYQLRRRTGFGTDSTTHIGTAELTHRLYDSVDSFLNFTAQDSTLENGDVGGYEARGDIRYRKRLPAGGLLQANTTLSYRWEDNDFPDRVATIPAEEQVVARLGSPLRLENPRILQDTIIVTDRAGATIYQDGIDYEIREVGVFTELVIAPTGTIIDGQGLLVQYRYETAPSVTFSTRYAVLGLRLNYPWVSPYLRKSRRKQALLRGEVGDFLDDVDIDTSGVEVRFNAGGLRFSTTLERTSYDSRFLAFRENRITPNLTLALGRVWQLSLNLNQSITDFTIPQRRTEQRGGQVHLTWSPGPRLSVTGFGRARRWRDSLTFDEDFVNYGIRLRWLMGKLRFLMTLEESSRERPGSLFRGFRGLAQITRSF